MAPEKSRPTGEQVRETVPDRFLDRADEVLNVDVTVEELQSRLRQGKVDKPEKVEQAPADPALIPERVMVCVSSSIDAPRVIRAGARIAGRLGARWYAVYVETPREAPGRISPGDRDALRRNISLAEELGATIVRVKADKPGDGLIAFARREGITHVVFGQTARTRWEILMKGSTLHRFLQEVGDAAVQVVPLGEH